MIRAHKNGWEVRVYAGPDPLTGKKRYLYGRAGSERDAKHVEAQLLTQVAQGRGRRTGARTVAELLERWLEWREADDERGLSPGTLVTYRSYITNKILPALGRLPLRRLDTETIDRFYTELRKRGAIVPAHRGKKGAEDHATARRRPMSASAIRDVHAILSGACKQAVVWGWMSHNPARLATPPAVRKAKVTPPTVEQVTALLAAALASELQFGLFLRLAVIVGARRGELCALRWDAVDFAAGEILIRRGVIRVPGQPLLERDTKNEVEARLAVDDATMTLLRTHHQQAMDAAEQFRVPLRPDAYVFTYTPDGSVPASPDSMSHKFAALAAGLEVDCRLHDLRHFMVTKLMSGGVDVRTTSGRARHTDPSMTLRVYAHFQRAQDRHAAELLAALCDREQTVDGLDDAGGH